LPKVAIQKLTTPNPKSQIVTCPGVFLQDKDDVYLSVSLFGQYKKSKCLRPVFPLLLHEKMTFKKVFPQAMDPAIMADMLECM
uniref:Spermatogenesis-associated protein 6 N-terminal domain-containing protein n=1 Tax=Erpetoichthys calabaricus TaxID=27687 RepID=A0A8C4SFS4_ERPCA